MKVVAGPAPLSRTAVGRVMRTCRYCEHDEPGDLIQVVDDDWQHRFWVCAETDSCDLRAFMRGLHLGFHIEGVA